MRLNERNKQNVYYALYSGTQTGVDADGLLTGENPPSYGPATKARMVVGVNSGSSILEQYGIYDPFTAKLVTDDVTCPVTTSSILWLFMGELSTFSDVETYSEGDVVIKDGVISKLAEGEWVAVPHTHVVTRVAKSFGYISYLVKEVEVTELSGEVNE